METLLDTGLVTTEWDEFDQRMIHAVAIAVSASRVFITLQSPQPVTRDEMRKAIRQALDAHPRHAITDEQPLGDREWRLQLNNGSVITVKDGEGDT